MARLHRRQPRTDRIAPPETPQKRNKWTTTKLILLLFPLLLLVFFFFSFFFLLLSFSISPPSPPSSLSSSASFHFPPSYAQNYQLNPRQYSIRFNSSVFAHGSELYWFRVEFNLNAIIFLFFSFSVVIYLKFLDFFGVQSFWSSDSCQPFNR